MKTASEKSISSDIESAASAWIARRDAGMTGDEAAEFERWRTADSRHAQAWERHERAWRMFDRPRSAGRVEIMMNELGALGARRRRRRYAAVAGGLLVLVIAVIVGRERQLAVSPVDSALSTSSAVVVVPEKRTLSDGSIVELKRGAEIAVNFSESLRRVSLRKGEALFHVAKNAARPFVVEAAGVEVKAVGTAFAVQLGSTQVEVFVTEGRIAVEESADTGGSAADARVSPAASGPTFANAGSRVVVDRTGQVEFAARPVVTAITEAELSERLEWRSPRLEFTGTPLGEAVQLMNRYNHVRLVIDPADADLAGVQVSGYFRADNVETFLHLIEQTLEIRTERSGDNTIALRKAR